MKKLLFFCLILFPNIILCQQLPQIGNDIRGNIAQGQFGTALTLSNDGSKIAISGPRNGHHVKVLEDSSGVWTQIGSHISGPNRGFGYSVDMSHNGSRLIIGDPGTASTSTLSFGRSTKIYEDSSGVWKLINSIPVFSDSSFFGWSVKMDSTGSRVAIGFPKWPSNDSAGARVLEEINGTWVQVGDDLISNNVDDKSGWAIDLSNDGKRLAVGAPNANNSNGNNAGTVKVYEDSSGTWVQIGSDINGDSQDDWLGQSVSLSSSGHRLIVGAPRASLSAGFPGQVKVFEDSAGHWVQVGSDIYGSTTTDFLGTSVSISGDGSTIAVGAPEWGNNSGKALVYQDSLGFWILKGSVQGASPGKLCGRSVDLSNDGSRLGVGYPSSRGDAKVFRTPPCPSSTGNILYSDSICPYGTTTVKLANGFTQGTGAWSNGQTGIDSVILSPGSYSVYYEDDSLGCQYVNNFEIYSKNTPPSVQLLPIDTICPFGTTTVRLSTTQILDSISWSNGQNSGIDSVTLAPGQYSVYYKNSLGCFNTKPFNIISQNTPPSVQLPPIDTICPFGTTTVRLSTTQILDSISWSNGQNSGIDSVTLAPGQYSVYYKNSLGCFNTKPFNVHYKDTNNVVVTPCYVYCDLDTGLNRVVIETPNGFENLYEWQLQEDVFGSWTTVSARPATDTSEWYHSGSNPFNKSYLYRVRLEDSCGVIRTQKTPIRTVLLQSSQGTSGEVNLNWNPYEGADVWYYIINRKQGQNFVLLDSVGATTTTYIDNNAPSGNVSYYVTAVRQSPCGNNLFKSGANTRRFSSNTVSESVIGIGEVLTDVVVSPNPTSGILNIVLTSLSEYEVFNINGQRVAQGKTEGQIDITNLPVGSYQIIITNDDGRSTHTIQKI